MKGVIVEIQVSTLIAQYIRASIGNTHIIPERGSILIAKVMQYLEPCPWKDIKIIPTAQTVTIQLPCVDHYAVYSPEKRKLVKQTTRYTNVVSEKGQTAINKYLYKLFRASFHTFMDGYTCANDTEKIIEGVTEFLLEYRLDVTNQNINYLKRDWVRYRKKKYTQRISPLLI